MIGKKIAEIRKSRGFTLSELAEKSNISKSYLSNIERDLNQNPSVEVVLKLANVLQVDIGTILSPIIKQDNHGILEKEWIEFVSDLKSSGILKEQLPYYKPLIEFIQWQNETPKLDSRKLDKQSKVKCLRNVGKKNECT